MSLQMTSYSLLDHKSYQHSSVPCQINMRTTHLTNNRQDRTEAHRQEQPTENKQQTEEQLGDIQRKPTF